MGSPDEPRIPSPLGRGVVKQETIDLYVAHYQTREQKLEARRQAGIAVAKVCADYLKKHYQVDRVILFGSMTRRISETSDIDLAVSNMPSERYFEALGRLSLMSEFPIDLVEIEHAKPSLLLNINEGWEL